MNPDRARQLFESGGILLILDAPKEMEFGIDMYSWQIGPQFRGIKMIPPGIHLCYYQERDRVTNEFCHRQSFFIEIHSANMMFIVMRWSKQMNFFEREQLTGEQYEIRRNQRYELDQYLGQYPLDTYRKWLSLSNHLQMKFIERLMPPSGHICSSNVYLVNDVKNYHGQFSVPNTLKEAESRLPQLTADTEYALRFTMIEKNQNSHSTGSVLTASKLDRTVELETIIAERFDSNVDGVLCELQFSFLVFLIGHVYDGFEHWKRFLDLICSCQKSFERCPKVYVDFLQAIFFELKQFSGESSMAADHLFADIDQKENCIHKSLENLFANIAASNDQQQMEGDDREKLIDRCQKMKEFLNQTYQWTFDDEPEDEKPIVVELDL